MEKFDKLGLSKKTVDVFEELGFTEPTEIQARTIPPILEGKDVIGSASTGSGKTIAFASGILENTVPGKGIQALILTPTRELAEQIGKVLGKFSRKTGLKTIEVFGGVPIERQFRLIRESDIVVGTPGRVLDHLNRRTLDLSRVKILVLDEADRMVDMGFLPDVEKIIRDCPKERQTLLFSATTSQDVDRVSRKYMKNPVEIAVEKYVDASKLRQVYYNVSPDQKFSALVHFLQKEKNGIVMVFSNTRRTVDSIAMNLKRYKINAQAIHGGLDQKKRSRIIEQFHKNEVNILVCTDVAARGLDIKGVTHVYNYDIPKTAEEYIHRVGRTARAGEEGIAVSLVSNRDYDNFRRVMMDDSLKIEEAELPEFERLRPVFRKEDDKRSGGYSRGGSRGGFRGRRDSGRGGGSPRGRGGSRSGRDSGERRGNRDRRDSRRGGGSYGRSRSSSGNRRR